MINPAEKLKAKQQEFISIRELIQRISRLHPTMSQAQIANWLLIELTDARPVSPPLLIQDALGVTRSPGFDDPNFAILICSRQRWPTLKWMERLVMDGYLKVINLTNLITGPMRRMITNFPSKVLTA
ncbi:Uncharacterised protein [Yersinia pseudotuberculosis]|nr:Uncharacterised protein [Yersinia pseudotuberculosis]